MINFARYDNNGRYTIVGSCEATSEDLLLPNTWIGEKVDPRTQYHAFGKPTAMPKKPSHHHTFDYSAKQWVDPRTEETQWALVRLERDSRLAACDWVRSRALDQRQPVSQTWLKYFQSLRDITQQNDPFNIIWPVAPIA